MIWLLTGVLGFLKGYMYFLTRTIHYFNAPKLHGSLFSFFSSLDSDFFTLMQLKIRKMNHFVKYFALKIKLIHPSIDSHETLFLLCLSHNPLPLFRLSALNLLLAANTKKHFKMERRRGYLRRLCCFFQRELRGTE